MMALFTPGYTSRLQAANQIVYRGVVTRNRGFASVEMLLFIQYRT